MPSEVVHPDTCGASRTIRAAIEHTMLHPLRRLAVLLLCSASLACSGARHPATDPTGRSFPTVRGESLTEVEIELPTTFRGAPALLLVGFEMETQFDIDRWLVGLIDRGTPIRFAEVPTIPGLVPGVFANQIDAGMRTGIPSEDWAGVITVYRGDASKIAEFTGNPPDRNARVLLLDSEGVVVKFHDRGFSPRVLLEFDSAARALATPPPETELP